MCIIIQRQPGVEIDFDEKFKPAVINNPHGYGISIPDGDGRLVTVKALKDEPDPDALYRLVQEDLKDEQLMLHLRYTTAGATSMRNLHPFPVLEKKTDGVDLRMAHNGTIHKFKHTLNSNMKWESDTRHFVRSYVRPLFKRFIKGMEMEDILTDPFIYDLLDDILPMQSVLAFIDGNGNTLEVNPKGNGGDYEEGWWYSNTYSFNPTHRQRSTTPSSTSGYRNGGSYGAQTGQVYRQDADGVHRWMSVEQAEELDNPSGGTTGTGKGNTRPSSTRNQSSRVYPQREHAMDTMTEKFSEKYPDYITTHTDLFNLSDDTLETILEDLPNDMLLLVKELMFHCHGQHQALGRKENQHDQEIRKLQSEIARLQKAAQETSEATKEEKGEDDGTKAA